jgi:hypothetical protein
MARTIHRRVQQGKMQAREANGVRLVCVNLRQDDDMVDPQQLWDEKHTGIFAYLTKRRLTTSD